MNPTSPLESLRGHAIPPGSPPPVEFIIQHIGKNGKCGLWVVFVVFVLVTLLMGVLTLRHEKRHRLFHFLFLLVAIVVSLCYYAMAVGSGYNLVNLGADTRDGKVVEIYRQVFWVRQADRAITMPLLLLALLLLAGVSWANIIAAMIANELAVVTGTCAALYPGRGTAKWGWFAFSCIFLVYVSKELLYSGFKTCRRRHSSLLKLYAPLAIFAVLIIVLYMVTFALAEITGVISIDWEVLIYAIFDISAKAAMGILVVSVLKLTSEDAYTAVLPDSFVEERGANAGPIQLPENE